MRDTRQKLDLAEMKDLKLLTIGIILLPFILIVGTVGVVVIVISVAILCINIILPIVIMFLVIGLPPDSSRTGIFLDIILLYLIFSNIHKEIINDIARTRLSIQKR